MSHYNPASEGNNATSTDCIAAARTAADNKPTHLPYEKKSAPESSDVLPPERVKSFQTHGGPNIHDSDGTQK